jgi:hypothetical protein
MAIYYSLGMEGVPFGQRHLSESHARAAARVTMENHDDIERVEILKITTQSFGFEYPPKAAPPSDVDLFKGIGL